MAKIVLDKEREIKFTFRALLDIEKELGVKLVEMGKATFGLNELFVLLYHGLKHEDRSLTKDKLLAILDNSDVQLIDLSSKINEALMEAFGNVDNFRGHNGQTV